MINILVADENPHMRQIIKSVLSDVPMDIQLKEADSGESVLNNVEEYDFNCIFINPNLPDQDSIEIYHKIKEMKQNAPSVIFLAQHDYEKQALKKRHILGLDVIEAKNLSPALVESLIQSALTKQELLTQISSLVNQDSLTSLNNRPYFIQAIEKSLSFTKRTQSAFGLILFDIDHFKDINQSMGHAFGDSLLRLVAHRLIETTRETDYIARIGSDEFGIIATNIANANSGAIFARRLINILSEPFWIGENKVYISIRLGIVIAPDDGDNAKLLLSHAETALQKSKNETRNSYSYYDELMNDEAVERLRIETDLNIALEKNQFELYYQPKIDLHSNKIMGAEALIRWNHPEKGLVPPDSFIPILEENKKIAQLGLWVIEEACRQMKKWEKDHRLLIPISVNLSVQQLDDILFVSNLKEILTKHQITPSLFEVEITETMLMKEVERISKQLRKIQDFGIKISIDDFGTGYSSLAYLKKLPVDILKIDKSFIQELQEGADDEKLTNAIISMGKIMNLKIIAEGVETKEQLDILKKINCDAVQGYYFSKPLPAKDFYKWYADRASV